MLTAFISGHRKDNNLQIQFSALFSCLQLLYFYSLREVLTEEVNQFTSPACQFLQLEEAVGRLTLKSLLTTHYKSSTFW